MKRDTRHKDHPKTRFPAVFSALHSEAKRYPGGIAGLGTALGRNPHSFSNKLAPFNLDAEPTAADLLEAIEEMQSRRTANAIAMLANAITVPVESVAQYRPCEVLAAFLKLAKDAGNATGEAAEALSDGVLTHDEREEIGALLDELISAAVAMRAVVRG